MAKTADDTRAGTPSARDLGQRVRDVRREQGLSRSDVARSSGLTRRELAAYERGAAEMPDTDLFCIAGSCGVDVTALLPERTPVVVDTHLSSVAIGDSVRRLRGEGPRDGVLTQYLSLIDDLRRLPPGSPLPHRDTDLAVLADALGHSPEAIEGRLVELARMSPTDAARVRALLVPTDDSTGDVAHGHPAIASHDIASTGGTGGTVEPLDLYRALAEPDTDDALMEFFATPRAVDPFDPPPPLEPEEVAPLTTGREDPFGFDPVPSGVGPGAPPVEAFDPIPSAAFMTTDAAAMVEPARNGDHGWPPPPWPIPEATPTQPPWEQPGSIDWDPPREQTGSLWPIRWIAPPEHGQFAS